MPYNSHMVPFVVRVFFRCSTLKPAFGFVDVNYVIVLHGPVIMALASHSVVEPKDTQENKAYSSCQWENEKEQFTADCCHYAARWSFWRPQLQFSSKIWQAAFPTIANLASIRLFFTIDRFVRSLRSSLSLYTSWPCPVDFSVGSDGSPPFDQCWSNFSEGWNLSFYRGTLPLKKYAKTIHSSGAVVVRNSL